MNAILRFKRERGYAPTTTQLGKICGGVPSTIWGILKRLEEAGYIWQGTRLSRARPSRAIKVLRMPYEVIWRMENGKLVLVKEGK